MKMMAMAALLAASVVLPAAAEAQTVDPGFRSTTLAANDDGATGAISLGFSANYFGITYTDTFVSNNGYLTFNFGQGTYTPFGLGAGYSGQPIIAAFFADVDTRGEGSALTRYGTGTYAGRNAFGATWDGVGYYGSHVDKLNSFQSILTDRSDTGAGNFDIYFNYNTINWETGDASGGAGGVGGTSAAVGFNAGTGNGPGTFFELDGSRAPGSFLDNGTTPLNTITNNGVPGQLYFAVRNGSVVVPPIAAGAAPEPTTWLMLIVGFGLVGAALRRSKVKTTVRYA